MNPIPHETLRDLVAVPQIKPCPFCGLTPTPDPEDEDFDDIPECLIAVTCGCIDSDDFSTNYVIADRWNTRAGEDALLARIEELEAQLAALPKWNPLTTTNRPVDGVFAIWIRRPISGELLIHYLDVGFQWAPYDTLPQEAT